MRETGNDEGDVLVWFSSHHRPFVMEESYCTNLDCPCNEAMLDFEEVCEDGARLAEPIRFVLYLDLRTWVERDAPRRDEQTAAFVAEFLAELSEERKQDFHRNRRHVRKHRERLATFTLPAEDVRGGRLLSFSDALVEDPGDVKEKLREWFDFQHEGETFLVQDFYCTNPQCPCEEVHLAFFRLPKQAPKALALREHFDAKVNLSGLAEVKSARGCKRHYAQAVLGAWLDFEPDIMEVLRERYGQVKEIGTRSLRAGPEGPVPGVRPGKQHGPKAPPSVGGGSGRPKHPTPPGTFVRKAPKVRPNDPCPCGSDRKYKRCCGGR
ncbi:MAG TPA: SEC-C metal-binding domain-containing protein [Phycisphaerae bacterium]|nr:SEC-C metal-binding domain-containing protein [Phycisphaerae bacterium]